MSSLSTNHVISLPQLEQTNCIANGGSTLKEEIADKLRISPDDVFNVFDLSKIKSDSSLEKGLVELTNIQTGSLLLQKIVKLAKDNSKKISLSCDGPKCEFNLKELKLSIPDDAFSDKKHPFLVKTDDGNFGIVKVAPPPAQVLAHELGHVLHFLEAGADVNTTEILENKTMEMLCAEYRYGQILGDIKIQADSFGYDPSNMSGSGAGLFLDMWNHANYTEIINILPEELFLDKSGLRDIIPKGTTIKKQWDRSTQQVNLPHIPKRGFRISDGIILREIVEYRAKIKMEQPKFYDSGDEEIDGNAMATNFIASRPESIMRIGHESANNLVHEVGDLDVVEKLKFGYLTNMLLSKIGVSVNDLPAVPKTQANTTAVSSSATSAAAAALTFPFLQDLKPTTFEQAYAKLCSEIATEMKKEYVACFFSENELLAFGKSLAENILSLDSPENLRDGIVENKVFDLLESKFGKGVQLNEELVKAFKQINKKSNAKQIKQAFKDGGWQLAVFPNFKSESSCNNIELFFGNENLCNNSTSGSVLTSARISELLNQINCLRSLHEKNFAQQTQT